MQTSAKARLGESSYHEIEKSQARRVKHEESTGSRGAESLWFRHNPGPANLVFYRPIGRISEAVSIKFYLFVGEDLSGGR